MKNKVLTAFVLLCLMLGCAHEPRTSSRISGSDASAAVGAAGTPALEVPEAQFDFGEMIEGETYVHDFVIRNRGTGVLEIEKITPG